MTKGSVKRNPVSDSIVFARPQRDALGNMVTELFASDGAQPAEAPMRRWLALVWEWLPVLGAGMLAVDAIRFELDRWRVLAIGIVLGGLLTLAIRDTRRAIAETRRHRAAAQMRVETADEDGQLAEVIRIYDRTMRGRRDEP